LPVIYIDVLLTVNTFIDYLLLCATARILAAPTTRKRLIAAAVVGALTTLIILLPPLPWWLSGIWQVFTAAVMVCVGFHRMKAQLFLKTTVVFFIISALFAGVCFALWWWFAPKGLFVQSGIVYYDVPPLLLLLLTAVSYLLLCLFERFTRKRVALGMAYRLDIIDGGRQITLRAMLDSGHSLTERFSGAPVIIVNAACVEPIAARYDIQHISGQTAARIRYVPFSTIGGEGLLTAFRPEEVHLRGGMHVADISGVWIAPTGTLGRGEYDALIGPALADRLISHS